MENSRNVILQKCSKSLTRFGLLSLFTMIASFGIATEKASFSFLANKPLSIFIPSQADRKIQMGAKELQFHLGKALKSKCPIVQSQNISTNHILLSANSESPTMPPVEKIPLPAGMLVGDNVVAFGGERPEETLEAIYHYLETKVGCRWFAPSETFIPTVENLTFTEGESLRFAPKIKWREVYYYEAFDSIFAARQRLNGNDSQVSTRRGQRAAVSREHHGGWGLWCHSIFSLLNEEPAKVFRRHPDYFALVNGKRIPPRGDGTQLCMSNPDLFDILKTNLEKAMKRQPSMRYWSVSQMDGKGFCTCAVCKAADNRDGSHIGSILPVINRLAKTFADKKVATLAYDYSRQPPRETKLEPNVIIQLCNIETARVAVNEPIGTSPKHAGFRNDITAWSRVCKEIVVWDYVVQFQTLVSPFPNFNVLQDNVKFFANNNVTGLFCQGNRERGGEFAELRTYLLALLLRDPDSDMKIAMKEFTEAYYGAAGKFIREYIDLMTDELAKSGKSLSMDGNPEAHRDGYLSEANIARYTELFENACTAVKGSNAKYLRRVEKEYAAVMFVQLRLQYGSIKDRKIILDRFMRISKTAGIFMLSEVDTRQDQEGSITRFRNKYKAQLTRR